MFLNGLQDMFVCLRMGAGDRRETLMLEIDEENTGHTHLFQGASDPEAIFE